MRKKMPSSVMNKKYLITLVLFICLIGVVFTYKKICASSPECACKNSPPGDPTCMGAAEHKRWCLEKKERLGLVQCQNLK